jgi:copper(I)-binding protein
MKRTAGVLILFVLLIGASACSGTENLSVENVWSRPGFQGDNSAIYLTIRNPGEQGDILLQALSDVAGAIEIHLSKMDSSGVMTMERQDQIIIPAQESVEFSPGGLHIMLVNLAQDLSVGDTFPITLVFEKAGELLVEVEVKQP